jgi:malate dehydrogenase (oxaloacetate-decarboxylating)(NADP+)
VFLNSLKERNETLFYYMLSHNLELLMPFIYTPTGAISSPITLLSLDLSPLLMLAAVGEACIKFSREFRVAQGMYGTVASFSSSLSAARYFCAEDKGHMAAMVENWPNQQVGCFHLIVLTLYKVDIIVATDGSRILVFFHVPLLCSLGPCISY